MRKLAIFMIVGIGGTAFFSACTKTCHCTTYVAGEATIVDAERTLDEDTYKTCKDMSMLLANTDSKYGTECK